MKKGSLVLLVIIFIMFFSTCLNTSLGANLDFPKWQVGNWWKFNVEIFGETNLVGTETTTIVRDDSDVFQNEQNFTCFQLVTLGGGTIYGNVDGSEIGGTWTLNMNNYLMKSDYSWVFTHLIYEETTSSDDLTGTITISFIAEEIITIKIVNEITFNPPFGANDGFPLTIGKSWSSATTETTKSQIIVNGNTEAITESEAYTKTFLILRKETIVISAGEFETYVIKQTDPDGTYSEGFYSPKVGTNIKEIKYDSTGTIETTRELLDYEYKSP
ncbi:MAG: hypothetical protein ACTSQB_04665, partial [Candidatus Heimdallarchaeota archaeon]